MRTTQPSQATVISITVRNPPRLRGRRLRERPTGIGGPRRALVAVAVTLALGGVGAVIATAVPGGATPRSAGAPVAERLPAAERAAIAGVLGYPYPLRCLTITLSASDPDFARASVDRTNGCGRYHGYTNASLHRVDNEWRLVLDEGQLFVPNSLLGGSAAVPAPRR